MDRKVIATVTVLSLAALAVALVMPGGRAPDRQPLLPWEVSRNGAGQTQVFGLTLASSTLGEARQRFEAEPKLNLFRAPNGEFAVEAYFQRLSLSGLRGDFVLSLEVDPERAEAIFSRGLRISRLGSGTQKVDLSEEDARALQGARVADLTYIPSANLNRELIASRFGEPAQRLREPSGIEHWLYPDKGLDIGLNPEGKEVLQYFNPAAFERISAPLQELSTVAAEG